MTTLQNLWCGNIRPNEDKVISDEEKRLVELIARHHETLYSSLKNDDLIVFEKYVYFFTEYNSLIEEHYIKISDYLIIMITIYCLCC